jgi:metal-responsive CopG/Arc/MetJ family transcriptional regulator
MKTIAITIDDDTLRRIDELTESSSSAENRSQFIREAVRERLGQIERLNEEKREKEIFRRNRQRLQRQALALIKEQAKQ